MKKNIERILAVLLLSAFCLSFASCSADIDGGGESDLVSAITAVSQQPESPAEPELTDTADEFATEDDTPKESPEPADVEPELTAQPDAEPADNTAEDAPEDEIVKIDESDPEQISDSQDLSEPEITDDSELEQVIEPPETVENNAMIEAVSEDVPKVVGDTVYITKTGKRYHIINPCGSGTYYEVTLQEALDKGLTPCQKCIG